MGEIIMNEREWAERALRTLTLGSEPVGALNRLSKYYHAQGHDRAGIARLLRDFMLRCDPLINIDMWNDMIESRAASAGKYPLIEVDGIHITKSEMETIQGAAGSNRQRVLFTLLCLAKFANAVNAKNRNWVNTPYSEVFRLAGLAFSHDRQATMIGQLWRDGYLKLSHIVDNVSVNVTFINEDSPVVLTITDFRNLGNQYLRYSGESYFECQECGLVIKKKSPRQKICSKCAAMCSKAP